MDEIPMFSQADYYVFQRAAYSATELEREGPWDYFLSAYDGTERVVTPFDHIQADHKQWILHEEYDLPQDEWPPNVIMISASFDPPAMFEFVKAHSSALQGKKVCIDSTGFIRPHLLILMWALRAIGVRAFDVLYTDPVRYSADEHTTFAGPVAKVEQVPGYQGSHRTSSAHDILIIGAGYDHDQIIRACEAKLSSKKYILKGLPSLQPHMYQESVLQIEHAREWVGSLPPQQLLYASASNPFTVAQTLHDVVNNEKRAAGPNNRAQPNLYLCPIGPKPHVIGFAVYYLRELENTAASIIFPFAESYTRLTTEGLMRTWKFQIEL